jgi:hypothetical protein
LKLHIEVEAYAVAASQASRARLGSRERGIRREGANRVPLGIV